MKSKKRWNWKRKYVRNHSFSYKGVYGKMGYLAERKIYCFEDHKKRREIEKKSLHKIMYQGYDEDYVYFPTKWKYSVEHYW